MGAYPCQNKGDIQQMRWIKENILPVMGGSTGSLLYVFQWGNLADKAIIAIVVALLGGLVGFIAKKLGELLWVKLCKRFPCLRIDKKK